MHLLEQQNLHDVVLVCHSYVAPVTTGAADRMPERVARLVYVVSGPAGRHGTGRLRGPDARAANDDLVKTRGQGWKLPPPWAVLGANVPEVDDTAVAALVEGSQPQPWLAATQPVALTGAWERLPRTSVLCSFTLEQLHHTHRRSRTWGVGDERDRHLTYRTGVVVIDDPSKGNGDRERYHRRRQHRSHPAHRRQIACSRVQKIRKPGCRDQGGT